ncbi:hypothetical protein [Vacuolonema iberomarrocanum]|nr:hypothetical protein [filamentous cyanobacterium LEGE 07170]
MASLKRQAFNQHLLERFIDTFDLQPSWIKSHPKYRTLLEYGSLSP